MKKLVFCSLVRIGTTLTPMAYAAEGVPYSEISFLPMRWLRSDSWSRADFTRRGSLQSARRARAWAPCSRTRRPAGQARGTTLLRHGAG